MAENSNGTLPIMMLHDRVLVRPDAESERRSAGGILIPATGEVPPATSVAEGLTVLLSGSGYLEALRASRDPQDEARLENLDEFVAVARDFARNHPDGTIADFLTEVALVSDADDLDVRPPNRYDSTRPTL